MKILAVDNKHNKICFPSDENRNMDSFWSSSPAGKIDEKYSKIADYTIVRPENPDISDIPLDAFVTDEVLLFIIIFFFTA